MVKITPTAGTGPRTTQPLKFKQAGRRSVVADFDINFSPAHALSESTHDIIYATPLEL